MRNFKFLFVALSLLLAATSVSAQSLGDILGSLGNNSGQQSGLGSTIGNVLSGIFTKSDLTLKDIVGEYVSDGPAVTFKSDNFLQKAGGIAGAVALETKLQPYFEKYGLTGMPLTIDADGKFTMKIKGIPMSGTVTAKDNKGEFKFVIQALGTVKIGQFTAYIQKSGRNIDLMFDAKKLKDFISAVGKFSGMKIAASFAKILDSYDGANIGFKMKNTGASSVASPAEAVDSAASQNGTGLENLFNILNKRKK